MEQLTPQQLKDAYYNADTGYTGVSKFYKKLKHLYPDKKFSLSDVRSWLDRQYTFQINRQGVRPKYYRTILANKPKDNYQVDVLVYNRYEDQGFKNILCVVDVNSRYVMCVPLKSRKVGTEEEIQGLLPAIKKVFDKLGKPKNVNSDNEFLVSKQIQQYFRDNNIRHHVSERDEINKQAIVERFNRTIARLIQRWRQGTGRTDWHNVLDDLVKNYNNSYHRTVKAKPVDIWEHRATNNQSPIHIFETELSVGDIVRIKQIKGILSKGDFLTYSPEEYVIVEKKDGTENGIKLKKFKLKNIATNEVLKRYYKDYELKQVSAIVEKYDKETDLAEKGKVAVEAHLAEKEKELQQEKEKVKELENLVPYTEPQKTKEVKRLTKDQVKLQQLERQLGKVKDVKVNTTIAERKKELNTFSTDTLRRLSTYYGLKTLEQYTKENGHKAWKYISTPLVKDAIVAEEKKRGLIV